MSCKRLVLVLVGVVTWTYGCSATYRPPTPGEAALHSQVVANPFDVVWSNLIQYAGGTFFGIEHFEKASGLITLSFGSADPSEFVTGGYFKSTAFEGDYVDYLARFWNGHLDGKMNIVVRDLGDGTSQVTVNARYVFSASFPASTYVPAENLTWSFESGRCATLEVMNRSPGTPPTRTLCPTYKAERAIISATQQ
jgi:hypothetical protein